MFAYPIVYDLVAMTTEDKDNVESLIDSIIGRPECLLLWVP